jgi:16S rRNA (uracil1498-N3)-methyltransferase
MHLFYTPDINNALYTLNEEESKHCIKVLRLQKGDVIYLVDGKGGFFTTHIIDDHPKKCTVEVVESKREFGKRNYYLHIAVAPTKNIERFEWFLEKATEIGIDEITPVICQRSERKEIKPERLNKIIESAMKQSIKAYHPVLNEAVSFKKFVEQKTDATKLIAHCMEGEKKMISNVKSANTTILIGPEGDFSEEEFLLAEKSHFIPITLGESRLRTETAALAACFEINYLNRK